MSKREMTKVKRKLEAKLAELSVAGGREELITERSNDPLDEIQARTDLDLTVQVINTGYQTRRAVENALGLLRTGEYGICEDCGEPINPKRLEAVPWTTVCVSCQEERDSQPEGSDTGIGRAA